jgi:hypothetical protein
MTSEYKETATKEESLASDKEMLYKDESLYDGEEASNEAEFLVDGEEEALDSEDILEEYDGEESMIVDETMDEDVDEDLDEEVVPYAAELELHEGDPSYSLSVNPEDPTLIASGGGNDKAVLFRLDDTETLKVDIIAELCGHTDTVEHVKFSVDGKLLATGSLDGTVRIWTTEGNCIHVLEGPSEVTVLELLLLLTNHFSGWIGIQRDQYWPPAVQTVLSGCGMPSWVNVCMSLREMQPPLPAGLFLPQGSSWLRGAMA